MSLNKEQVAKVARLARIKMTDEKLDVIAPELNNIINWVEMLGEVDTDAVEPLPSPVDIPLKMRKDEVTDGGYQKDILANAPETLEGFFVVPKVVE